MLEAADEQHARALVRRAARRSTSLTLGTTRTDRAGNVGLDLGALLVGDHQRGVGGADQGQLELAQRRRSGPERVGATLPVPSAARRASRSQCRSTVS